MEDIFNIILLLALPASGKSETRKFLASHDEKTMREVFHFGTPIAQLDDFPYVHMMRRIDVELKKMGQEYLFFHAPDKTFKDPHSWGLLTLLISEDYEKLIEKKGAPPDLGVADLLRRFDSAREKLGVAPLFYGGGKPLLPEKVLDSLFASLKGDYDEMSETRRKEIPSSIGTLIIEFARGGPDGATMPLPFGYEYNLGLLSPLILKKAAILYVWVTPEESRRKNFEREDPNDPGSILAHCVPLEVMMKEYGCDDMEFLMKKSDREGYIRVEKKEGIFHIPVVRFDNRQDKTSFVRDKVWKEEDRHVLFENLKDNLTKLYGKYREILNKV